MPTQPSVLRVMETTRRIQEYEVSIDGSSGGTLVGFLEVCCASQPYGPPSPATKQDFSFVDRAKLMHPAALAHSSEPAMTYLLPPLNAVRAFEAAARHLSFKQAAHELHVTAGAVSQQDRLLEEPLGVRLFERLTRAVMLTSGGETYPIRGSQAFCWLADATSQLRPVGVTSLLHIGVP